MPRCRRALCCVLLLALPGCQALASREAAAGCQAADLITTERALRLNPNAYEQNPLPLDFIRIVKLALIGFIIFSDSWNDLPEGFRVVVTVVGCAPVPGNIRAARQ